MQRDRERTPGQKDAEDAGEEPTLCIIPASMGGVTYDSLMNPKTVH